MSVQSFTVDSVHSSVGFTARHMVVSKVHGRFAQWSAALLLDEADLTQSSVEVHIDAASIDTQAKERDNHLRSPDFFDVAQFPELVFKSRKVERAGPDQYRIVGELAIHGVTKEVVLETEFNGAQKSPWGDERIGFSAHTSLNRSDFGLSWNKALETGGLLVSEKIEIAIELEAVRPANAATTKAA